MFSVVPNIVFVPNMTQNAERKHRTQDTNTAHFQSCQTVLYNSPVSGPLKFANHIHPQWDQTKL